ncbi:nucleotide sugar dehydrogenase [Streptomyces tubbatahanensis]|uniref:Nucleotide sugar dehydrogenase n=1 Tax=Streptomyces tubbatahanensis TaxID=2923272 RepID=A0ABY3XZD9_9ACTN|nr:nucleotide sugar dehydrogenase [Streptomyces tubbatahanensis]UNS99844.1 nucleotide sugar dehydrogenase [Streptomyces tubbatahanensis]
MACDLAVVGLGYIGLPLAQRACAVGLSTVGYDVSAPVVDGLATGSSHVDDVSDGEVAAMGAAGFRATTDPSVLAGAGTIVVCVPTGLSAAGDPDLDSLRAAIADVAAQLRPGTLVVVESTSHPGTTEEIVRPALERGSGLTVGEDFHLAYSPERIDPGNSSFTMSNTPRVVSGCTPLCAKHAVAFYGRLVDTVVVARGTREAEMAKLLENTYRYVNIALVDEVALFCDKMGIDIWDVLHCAATKPFGFTAFSPGAGVGGHCIPVDPRYLAVKAESEGFSFDMLSAARQVLGRMPRHVVQRVAGLLEAQGRPLRGARVLLLGVTYKPDIADTRESPAFAVAALLRAGGAHVSYHDPYVPSFDCEGTPLSRRADLAGALADSDLALLLQDHACYDPTLLARAQCPVLDTRGRTAGVRVTRL